MKKTELIALAERHKMQFMRHYITREGIGVYCETTNLIQELDEICDRKEYDNVIGERIAEPGVGYIYRLYCPAKWIDLFGWR